MTKDTALRLALEALKEIIHWYAVRDRNDVLLNFVDQNPEIKKAMKAITAIEATLETKDEPVVWNKGVPAMLPKQKEGETFIVSYEPKLEAKHEPVQEPWESEMRNELVALGFDGQCPESIGITLKRWRDGYASAQRTWVGLSDEERKDLCRSWSSPMDAIYATEAKLKELNT